MNRKFKGPQERTSQRRLLQNIVKMLKVEDREFRSSKRKPTFTYKGISSPHIKLSDLFSETFLARRE